MSHTATASGAILRDRTEEFCVLRRAAMRQQAWVKGSDEPMPLTQEQAVGRPPTWITVVENFTDLEKNVHLRLERLVATQREVFAPRFQTPEAEKELQQECEKLSGEVQKLLKELERLIQSGIRHQEDASSDELNAATNVKKHLSKRLSEIVISFRSAQQGYADQLKKRDDKREKYKKFGPQEIHERLATEEKVCGYLEQGYSQAQINELLLMEQQAIETNKEVQQILQGVMELNQMFADMRDMIVEQGTLLDRVDYNIEKTAKSVEKGVAELQKAREHQKKCVIV